MAHPAYDDPDEARAYQFGKLDAKLRRQRGRGMAYWIARIWPNAYNRGYWDHYEERTQKCF